MIAIFNTEQESINFSNLIHQFLCVNRGEYEDQTEKWSSINKSYNDDKWCVPLPEDYNNYTEKLNLNHIELITNLPENWNNTEEL